MTRKDEEHSKNLFQLYNDDPEGADRRLFGRESHPDRRGFLRGAGLAAMGAAIGTAIPFHRNMPSGFIPMALAETAGVMQGKDGLTVYNDRPVNAETPAHLLDDAITPTARHFIRNNGVIPENVSPGTWELSVEGLVGSPMKMSIADLKSKFEVVERALVLECGGNGRAFFNPPASGNQWTYGAVACSKWTGVRLADVLKAAGVKDNAVYTAHYDADTHLSGDPKKIPISRGVPVAKAMDPNNLIAFEMNGAPIHPMNGAPLRLVIPGWPGSCSQKWLTKIVVRDKVHDGPKMTGTAYRVPNRPVAPGEKVDDKDYEIIEAMPVKSLITSPETGKSAGRTLKVQGHAWAGDNTVRDVHISIDFSATWIKANLDAPVNPYAWQNWHAQVAFPKAGYYEVWARATNDAGVSQPFAVAWNPKGYINKSMHRISVRVA
jgi:DMSO/TMAO reductase YedYZ molybdopterin-dependent catalytic subunit